MTLATCIYALYTLTLGGCMAALRVAAAPTPVAVKDDNG
jgi:hypothetical protein